MTVKKLAILGSTGSIGTQALEIVDEHPDSFSVVALSANNNWKQLASQANKYRPSHLLLCNESKREKFISLLTYKPESVVFGTDMLAELAVNSGAHTLLNSLVGFVGFRPTYNALNSGLNVALANKESLVVGGEVISELLDNNDTHLIPVDSEHSAMLQCLEGEQLSFVEKIIITASGGPFRTWPAEKLKSVRVEDALDHPNWSMGSKITVDSSTLMNKGLEIIEAHWLFGVPYNKIEPVIHPESIIHSVIEFIDGSSKAQLGPPDMKVPILYALTYPKRMNLSVPRIDWSLANNLTFEPVDFNKFPCLRLAIDAGIEGGHKPAILNAANEVAVERFLKKEIGYIDISRIVEKCLERVDTNTDVSFESLTEVDLLTRKMAKNL